MYILTLVALLCLYVLIYLKLGEDLVEKKTVLHQKKEQLDVQEQMILLSQIRPKYILSALDTISQLCLTDADEAYSLTTSTSGLPSTKRSSCQHRALCESRGEAAGGPGMHPL